MMPSSPPPTECHCFRNSDGDKDRDGDESSLKPQTRGSRAHHSSIDSIVAAKTDPLQWQWQSSRPAPYISTAYIIKSTQPSASHRHGHSKKTVSLMNCLFNSFLIAIIVSSSIITTCIAINPLGTVTETPCDANQVPPIPMFLRAQQVRNDSVKLIWSMPVNAAKNISEFVLSYGKIPDEYMREIKSPQARQILLENLSPGVQYTASIRAKNCLGDGQPVYVDFKTLATSGSDKGDEAELMMKRQHIIPMALKAEPTSSTSVLLTWTDSGGASNSQGVNRRLSSDIVRVVEVRFQISSPSASANGHTIKNYTTWDNRVVIDELTYNTTYTFAIRTYLYSMNNNRKMTRETTWSLETTCRTPEPDPPSAPLNLSIQAVLYGDSQSISPVPIGNTNEAIDPSKVELTWRAPEKSNGILQGYIVHLTDDTPGTAGQWRSDQVGAGRTNALIRDLLANVTYSFKVQAVNERVAGPFSNIKTYRMPSPTLPTGPVSSVPTIGMAFANLSSLNYLVVLLIVLPTVVLILVIIVAILACKARSSNKANSSQQQRNLHQSQQQQQSNNKSNNMLANGYSTSNSVSRMATLGRSRRDQAANELWINQLSDQLETKSSASGGAIESTPSDMNLAMVSMAKRDSAAAKFTTQLAQSGSQYGNSGHLSQNNSQFMYSYDEMDDTTGPTGTLSKRMPPPAPSMMAPPPMPAPLPMSMSGSQPVQQPPPPPPLNIEQSQHAQQLYGTGNTRSLRLNRQLLYDPVAGSFVQTANEPNHQHQHMSSNTIYGTTGHVHMGHTLGHAGHSATLSRRASATLRSFQSSTGAFHGHHHGNHGLLIQPQAPQAPNLSHLNHMIQIHPAQQQQYQGVIAQLNSTPYSSLPLKHVSAVRPQPVTTHGDNATGSGSDHSSSSPDSKQKQQHQQQQMIQQQQQLNGVTT